MRFRTPTVVPHCIPAISMPDVRCVDYFTHAHDVAASVMELLTISDLHSMSRTSRSIRAVALAVMRRRFRSLLVPYAATHLAQFIQTMRYSGAVITGSVARAMITGVHGIPPVNLNVIVPYRSFRLFDAFIRHVLFYNPISSQAHPAVAPAVYRFRQYASGQRVITMSAARASQSVLHIILNAPSTADMVIMSVGGVAWFYPQWHQEGIAVRTRSSEFVASDHKLGYNGYAHDIRIEPDLK